MERYRLTTATINGGMSQRLTFQSSASSHISLPPKPHLREPSTPSYPRPETSRHTAAGDRLIRRADDTEISIFDAERYFNGVGNDTVDKKRTIFLNEINQRCNLSANPKESSVSSIDGYGRNGRNGSTPTVSSEASWNSQSGLLTNPPGPVAVSVRAFPLNEQRRGKGSSSCRRLFGRKCPCLGKKSVDVEEKLSDPTMSPIRSICESNNRMSIKQRSSSMGVAAPKELDNGFGEAMPTKMKITPGNWIKEKDVIHGSYQQSPEKRFETGHRIVNSGKAFGDTGGFSFPILNSTNNLSSIDEPARQSLEVFLPREDTVGPLRRSAELHRRAMTLAGENGRRSFTSPASPRFRIIAADDDVASDTSSDLFEIESFSTSQATSCRRRDSLDDIPPQPAYDARRISGSGGPGMIFLRSMEEAASVAAMSECYAPSEVSVEWSVTTAEGFANFSSAASEYEDVHEEHDRFASGGAATAVGGGRWRGSGGRLLTSCRCEKAVNVGPHPVRFVHDQGRAGAGQVFVPEPERVGSVVATRPTTTARLGGGTMMPDRAGLGTSYSARRNQPVTTR